MGFPASPLPKRNNQPARNDQQSAYYHRQRGYLLKRDIAYHLPYHKQRGNVQAHHLAKLHRGQVQEKGIAKQHQRARYTEPDPCRAGMLKHRPADYGIAANFQHSGNYQKKYGVHALQKCFHGIGLKKLNRLNRHPLKGALLPGTIYQIKFK
jgi:hypothetical protein